MCLSESHELITQLKQDNVSTADTLFIEQGSKPLSVFLYIWKIN